MHGIICEAPIISITERGRPKKVTKQRAVLKAITAQAARGDPRAANILINMTYRLLHADVTADDQTDLSAEDQAILDDYVTRAQQASNVPTPTGPGATISKVPSEVSKKEQDQ